MKKKVIAGVVTLFCVCLHPVGYAQFVVSDPGNTAVNSVHSSITSILNALSKSSFGTLVKDVESLKKVSSGIQQASKVTEVMNQCSQTMNYMNKISQVVSTDRHFSPQEYQVIAQDLRNISQKGLKSLTDMKGATAGNLFRMSDHERLQWMENVSTKIAGLNNILGQFYSTLAKVSSHRATSIRDRMLTSQLYQTGAQALNSANGMFASSSTIPYYMYGIQNSDIRVSSDSSAMDTYADQKSVAETQRKMDQMNYASQQYSSEYQLREIAVKRDVVMSMLAPVGPWVPMPKLKKNDPQLFANQFTGQLANEQEFNLMVDMEVRKRMVPVAAELKEKWGLDKMYSTDWNGTDGNRWGGTNGTYTPTVKDANTGMPDIGGYTPGVFTPKEPDPVKVDVYIPPITVINETKPAVNGTNSNGQTTTQTTQQQ